MIQIHDGYVTYCTVLQTMVQNYSASDRKSKCQKIICKQFETRQSFEDAQVALKEYNTSLKLDEIDLTSSDNNNVDATPAGTSRDSTAVIFFWARYLEQRCKEEIKTTSCS